ncbi:VSP [Giardia lamblia P15]|uniref:VSP n=1 Tax=Giardia intestinalis (strain P15) TaxID=658858 RepID=E1F7P6_GIAIA|nr:VSP [Giardia lamblia P15]
MLVGLLLVCAAIWANCAAGCKTCNPGDQACTECTDSSHNIQVDGKSCDANCPQNSAANDQKVCVCSADYSPVVGENRCERTPSVGCAAGCKTCNPGDQACTECTDSSHNIQVDGKSCDANCPQNSAANDQKVCVCSADYSPVVGENRCERTPSVGCNTPNCKACDNPKTDREVCTECNDNSYLTPTSQCVKDCTTISGYYGDTNEKKCRACNPECAECVGPANNQCSACPAGKSLEYGNSMYPNNGGTCGDACKTTGGSTGCKVCGSTIGETLYCSQCNNNDQAPLNGNCAVNTRAAFCATITSGACTKCNEGYFLKDGGCYQTDRQPGKQVCGTAGQGVCTKCANGLPADNGDCSGKKCHESCSTCNGIDEASCLICATGYYKENGSDSTAGPCKRCSERIPSCKQCTSPSAGSVICLESEAGTGGNVNKSGLSTGAIAGIAVAVIIVVGGLVGFLCWWFLCRGKA